MDIAKYIGLYLLKNRFCYVHGLGNLELRKIRATHDGESLQAPTYDVIVTLGGSIDDSFANFIATNEQISISKAANTLREFSTETRKSLATGQALVIPGIGQLEEHAGKISFVTDKNFSYAPTGIPTVKNSKQLDEQNIKLSHKPSYPPPAKADSINWRTVVLVVVFILVLSVGGYFAYEYINAQNTTEVAVTPVLDTVVAPEPQPEPLPEPDTASAIIDSVDATTPAFADSNLEYTYKMVIGDYPTRERAEKRVNNLIINGNKVELFERDSTSFLVVTPISCKASDTTHIKDSLKVMFGFKKVQILSK